MSVVAWVGRDGDLQLKFGRLVPVLADISATPPNVFMFSAFPIIIVVFAMVLVPAVAWPFGLRVSQKSECEHIDACQWAQEGRRGGFGRQMVVRMKNPE